MEHELRLCCCRHFQKEVETLVKADGALKGLSVQAFSVSCLQGSQQKQPPGHALATEKYLPVRSIVMGGGCMNSEDCLQNGSNPAAVIAPQLCFHLVAPPALVDHLIAQGGYLLTPGWLANWQEQIAGWGFDQPTARQFFQETTQRLVLLDTGIQPGSRDDLAAMGAFLGLPWQVVPVGLDTLGLRLERTVLELNQNRQSIAPPDQFFADHLMVIDLMNDLLSTAGSQEALDRVRELYVLLFAPGRLDFPACLCPRGSPPGARGPGFSVDRFGPWIRGSLAA